MSRFYHDNHIFEVNGKQFPVYFYDQLETLQKREVQTRALNLKEALGLQRLNVPNHKESLVLWILEVQGKAMGQDPSAFGAPSTGQPYHRSSSPTRAVSPARPMSAAPPSQPPAYAYQGGDRQDHFQNEGTAAEGRPGLHGHEADDDFQGGMERGIGHGKRHVEVVDHFQNEGTTAGDTPGLHGHEADDDFQGGMERGIGHGKRHIEVVDHFQNEGVIVGDAPGSHGHSKDDDFGPDGLPRGIGHGIHEVSAEDVLGNEEPPPLHPAARALFG